MASRRRSPRVNARGTRTGSRWSSVTAVLDGPKAVSPRFALARISGHTSAAAALSLLCLIIPIVCFQGCTVDVHDGVGPRVPIPNVEGLVVRVDAPAGNLDVDLRDAARATVLASTSTDRDGEFWFADIGTGIWEIKVSGAEEGDFNSVSREFSLEHPESLLTLAPMDVFAYGVTVLEPPDSGVVPKPNPFEPVTFRWILPEQAVKSARVRLYDGVGQPVWSSPRTLIEEALWNGLGNRGSYDGQLVPAGGYSWCVKMEFQDDLEARTDYRELELQ